MRMILHPLIVRAAMAVALAIFIAFGLAGCSKGDSTTNPKAGKTPAKKTSTAPAAQTGLAIAPPPTNIFLSVFSTDNPRDPFHPKIKPKTASQPILTGVGGDSDPSQLVAALQAGFQGIFGSA